MKLRTSLLLAALVSTVLVGCGADRHDDAHPRLLTGETARISYVDSLGSSVALEEPQGLVMARHVTCVRHDIPSPKPRLVIGEPVCEVSLSSIEAADRID